MPVVLQLSFDINEFLHYSGLKNMKSLIIFIYVLAFVAIGSANKYCSITCDYFGSTVQNIGCTRTNNKLGRMCQDAKIVNISPALKKLIVDAHNAKREIVASGGIKHLKRPCNLPKMQWDDDLAYLAQLNVQECDFNHDQCHDTSKFTYSGQNLGMKMSPDLGFQFDEAEAFTTTIDGWFAENKDCTQAHINSFPLNPPKIGHFTVMVHEKSTAVGCGAIIYTSKSPRYRNILIACNYAYTNMIDNPIYKSC